MRFLAVPALMIAATLAALFAVSAPRAQGASWRPVPPVALVVGGQVQLSWRLPVSPRPLQVVIYRGEAGLAMARIATVSAETRVFLDSSVEAARTYEYAIAIDQRGLPLSAMSGAVRVSVGRADAVVFRGGTVSRGVFEVALVAAGRRWVETFVCAPGEVIGDLRRAEGAESALDFRLGYRLVALKLEFSASAASERQPALDSAGSPMVDISGRAVELALPANGEVRERLVAEVELPSGKRVVLTEGDGISP